MKLEDLIFQLGEGAAAYQDEIGDVFLVLAAPTEVALPPGDEFERDLAHVLFFRSAVTEAGKARPEDGAQNAVAGSGLRPATEMQPESMALRAGIVGLCYFLCSIPFI